MSLYSRLRRLYGAAPTPSASRLMQENLGKRQQRPYCGLPQHYSGYGRRLTFSASPSRRYTPPCTPQPSRRAYLQVTRCRSCTQTALTSSKCGSRCVVGRSSTGRCCACAGEEERYFNQVADSYPKDDEHRETITTVLSLERKSTQAHRALLPPKRSALYI